MMAKDVLGLEHTDQTNQVHHANKNQNQMSLQLSIIIIIIEV